MKSTFGTSPLVLLCFFAQACALFKPKSLEQIPRAGVLSLEATVNSTKPLAEGDYSGWVADQSGLFVGTYADRWVVALDQKSTNTLWWLELSDGIAGPLTIIDRMLYVNGRDGTLNQVDLASGKIKWKTKLSSFAYRKIISNGNVVYAVTAAQQLYSLDIASGNVNWIFDGGFPDGLTIASAATPIIHDDAIIIGLAKGDLVAVNTNTGREVWRYANDAAAGRFHDINGSYMAKANKLYLTRYDGKVACLDLTSSTFSKVWDKQVASITTSAVIANQIIVGTHNGDLRSFELNSGRELWSTNIGVTPTTIYGNGGTLWVASSNGRINKLSIESGALDWHDEIGGRILASPLRIGSVVYFATGYRNLYGYYL